MRLDTHRSLLVLLLALAGIVFGNCIDASGTVTGFDSVCAEVSWTSSSSLTVSDAVVVGGNFTLSATLNVEVEESILFSNSSELVEVTASGGSIGISNTTVYTLANISLLADSSVTLQGETSLSGNLVEIMANSISIEQLSPTFLDLPFDLTTTISHLVLSAEGAVSLGNITVDGDLSISSSSGSLSAQESVFAGGDLAMDIIIK